MKLGRLPIEFPYAGPIWVFLLGDAVEIVVFLLCSFSTDNLRVPVSNEDLVAKLGFHTAENEPCKVRTLSLCGEQPECVDPARTAPFAVEVYRPEPYVCAVKKSGSVPNFH